MSEPGEARSPEVSLAVVLLLEDLRAVDGELLVVHQRGEAVSRAAFHAAQTLEAVRRAVAAGEGGDAVALISAVAAVKVEAEVVHAAIRNLGELLKELPIRLVVP